MEQLQATTTEKEKRQKRNKELRLFIKAQNTAMPEWSDKPWILLSEKATVYHDGRMTFLFKDGIEITV